jgi:hypothetical protein
MSSMVSLEGSDGLISIQNQVLTGGRIRFGGSAGGGTAGSCDRNPLACLERTEADGQAIGVSGRACAAIFGSRSRRAAAASFCDGVAAAP